MHNPWTAYDIDVWIVIDIDNFTSEDVGSHRVDRTIFRDMVDRGTVRKRAPDVRTIESAMRRDVPVVDVGEQTINMRSRTVRAASTEPAETRLRKMVLPKTEKRKIDKHAPRIEKEVLTRRRTGETQPNKSSEEKRNTTRRK